ncbi:MAG: DUF1573 domain-containing protein [Bacteroidales bacterium]|jgi:hypothetical protein|nr:DUF1573 domain-containing protein [Bacteroidales bacterium]MDY0315146.1 DUF1573 domain-containing protein [Bacteroidales bacterium]NLB87400.1 DUF1573 domain-containing protein [Bacteroidales bacterium]
MKKIFLIICLTGLYLFSFSQSQQPMISWEKTVHDFGNFKEEAGNQTYDFIFTNTGSMPLYITNVRASCGCTATDYTKEPVAPGTTGFVRVTYNPKNRPGKFNKSVTVSSNTENATTLLRITGDVTPREKGIEDFYPRVFDDLRLRTSHLAMAQVYNKSSKTDTIGIVNMSSETMEISFDNVPPHINISVEPKKLAAKKSNEKHGGKGLITVTYDASKKNDWGFSMDRVSLVINGQKNAQNRLSISATVEEDFSHLTEDERANSPKIEFNNLNFEFGTIKSGEKTSHNFVFTNSGKSDLIIRKIKASCGCTATNPEKMIIKPGETSHITSTFNSVGKKGQQNKTITVITNDPSNPTTVLRVIGNVEEVNN